MPKIELSPADRDLLNYAAERKASLLTQAEAVMSRAIGSICNSHPGPKPGPTDQVRATGPAVGPPDAIEWDDPKPEEKP